MSPVTIRLRRVVTHADHIRVQAHTAAAVAHIHAAAGAVDTHHAAVEDRHLMAVGAVLHRTAEAAEVTASRNHLPAIAKRRKASVGLVTKKERRTTNRRSFCFSG